MLQPLVITHDLTKRYTAVTALDRCTLEVPHGEVFGLLGPNGSGKTTLLRLLMGFLRPTSGRAAIDGLDCYRNSVEVHRRVAYLPGDVRLFGNMRGRDVLRFFSRIRRGGDLRRELELADRLGLDVSRPVARMSTGMRQKLALAAVMAVDTPLVILDEPTANLDPSVRGIVLSLVSEARQAGRAVIFFFACARRSGTFLRPRGHHARRQTGPFANHRRPAAATPHSRPIDGALVAAAGRSRGEPGRYHLQRRCDD